ncbi:MAG: BCCT family transporter [Streptosporangiales bacterium]
MSTTQQEAQPADGAGSGAQRRGPLGVDPTVFGVSMGLIIVFCVLGAIWPEATGGIANAALGFVIKDLGWVFILAATAFVGFALVLAFSRYGRIPLSKEGERPEFSTLSWIAMMFSAGMGIGLMFYGVFEPVSHLTDVPPGMGAKPGTPEAAQIALGYTFFHWGLHPWAIYAVVGLALAYSTFRKGRGNLISSPFQSLFGKDRIERRGWGKPIDIWAIIAAKFGGATSLGLGALQIAGGLLLFTRGHYDEKSGFAGGVALVVIAVLVAFAIVSAVSGVARGIKWLSNTNMVVAGLLVIFVLVAGPTVYLLDLVPAAFGAYINNFIHMSFNSPAFGGLEWFSGWTIFYWAWWISWTPFVATFIARISRGRTIREFVIGVLVVPTVISALWFVILGGAGMKLQMNGVDLVGSGNAAIAFFNLLQQYPFFTVAGGAVMFLTAIFWVSGADASALVLAMLSSYGTTEPNKWLVALWAFMSAVVAAVLLSVGGLQALQTFDILVASPFVLVMIGLCIGLYVDLRRDPLRQRLVGPVRGYAPSPGAYASVSSAIMATRTAENGGGDGSGSGQQQSQPGEEEEVPQRT